MTGFSLHVTAFLKCHLFLEVFIDFPYNVQFPAQSLPQMEKWWSYDLSTFASGKSTSRQPF